MSRRMASARPFMRMTKTGFGIRGLFQPFRLFANRSHPSNPSLPSLALLILSACLATPGDGGEVDKAGASDQPLGAAAPLVNVLTRGYDNQRTSANGAETVLTVANVNPGQFGKLFEL